MYSQREYYELIVVHINFHVKPFIKKKKYLIIIIDNVFSYY